MERGVVEGGGKRSMMCMISVRSSSLRTVAEEKVPGCSSGDRECRK